jgi:hypothetical protein
MTTPADDAADLTADDHKVRQTDNGWHDGDGPQPEQTSTAPAGSPTEESK